MPPEIADLGDWLTPDQFAAKYPAICRSVHSFYRLVAKARANGLSEAGAVKRVPGLGWRVHPGRWAAWIERCGA